MYVAGGFPAANLAVGLMRAWEQSSVSVNPVRSA